MNRPTNDNKEVLSGQIINHADDYVVAFVWLLCTKGEKKIKRFTSNFIWDIILECYFRAAVYLMGEPRRLFAHNLLSYDWQLIICLMEILILANYKTRQSVTTV